MKGKSKKGKRRKEKLGKLPRVTVGEALRALGVDEWTVALGLEALAANGARRGGSTQAFLRVLQECKRELSSSETLGEEISEEDLMERVKLIHEVERPMREEEEEEDRSIN